MRQKIWFIGLLMGGLFLLVAVVWQTSINGDMPLFAAPAFLGVSIIGFTFGFHWGNSDREK